MYSLAFCFSVIFAIMSTCLLYTASANLYFKGRAGKTDMRLRRSRHSDPMLRGNEIYQCLERFSVTFKDTSDSLRHVRKRCAKDTCTQEMVECDDEAKYRTASGRCNNLENPGWGASMVCQERLLPAYYVGSSGFRTSIDGGPLPSPRKLSLNLHFDQNRPNKNLTHLNVFFGQLLAHDIVVTPVSVSADNERIKCCPPQEDSHPQCQPVLIEDDDPFYSKYNITCLNLVRSVICPTCSMGKRQQINGITSFIDASFVYGSTGEVMASLRANDGTGRMMTQRSHYGDLLPDSLNPENDKCSFPDKGDICFRAGDNRVNQHTVLTCLQTVFMREHNWIVTELSRINPDWDDEKLFQEGRRIVGAELQVIVYKEYLPLILDIDSMTYFSLYLSGGRTTYDPEENPTILHEFSTAAYRFGHSMINHLVARRPRNVTEGYQLMRNLYFRPFGLHDGFMGPLVKDIASTPAQTFDRHLVTDVTNFLYRAPGQKTGLDLASLDIQRGRDHGIPAYVEMVEECSFCSVRVRSFEDLVEYGLMTNKSAEALSDNYRYVQDVDLWPALLMEIPNRGSVVGPTSACIIGLQFYKLKYGDRFYLEHRGQDGSFTSDQLRELKKTTLTRILCTNTNVRRLPSNSMLFKSPENPLLECSNVRDLDLSLWKDRGL